MALKVVGSTGSSARWGVEKPAPAFFERIVSECGVDEDAIAYVGDRVDNDVEPALAAGMVAVHIRRGPWGHLHEPPPAAFASPRSPSCGRRSMSELRVGIGVDAHALEDGVPLVLGGVAIEHPRGLAGHSDGDVIAHALTDAVLGAAGLGDIGGLFPSGDPRWHGADSLDLLRDAFAQVRGAGFELVNADCVLIGEEPRIADTARRCASGSPARSASSASALTCERPPPTGSASQAAAKGSRPRRLRS